MVFNVFLSVLVTTQKKVDPHELVTEEGVKAALKSRYGSDADLVTWEVHDFTSKGDNYLSFVTSVLVKYKKILKI